MGKQRGSELIRAFIALQPGEGNLPGLLSTVTKLGSGPQGDAVRWVRAENLHITLRFLGSIHEDAVGPLLESVRLEAGEQPAFDLSVGPAGLFPRGRRPRVVAAALEPEEPLIRLAKAVERGVVEAGLPGEDRTFRAHLTLGRIKRNAPRALTGLAGNLARVNSNTDSPATSHQVRQIALYRSDLNPGGPVYTELWSVPLAGA